MGHVCIPPKTFLHYLRKLIKEKVQTLPQPRLITICWEFSNSVVRFEKIKICWPWEKGCAEGNTQIAPVSYFEWTIVSTGGYQATCISSLLEIYLQSYIQPVLDQHCIVVRTFFLLFTRMPGILCIRLGYSPETIVDAVTTCNQDDA